MKKNIGYLLVLLLFKSILEFGYFYFLNSNFSYLGYTLDFNIVKYLESLIAIIWIFYIIPKNNSVTSIAVNILLIMMIIPIISIYSLKDESRSYFYYIITSFSVLLLTVQMLPRVKLNTNFNFNALLKFAFISITALVYVLLIRFNGLPNLRLLDFNEVYIIRSGVNYGYSFMKYLVTWQGAIINVFAMIVALVSKRKNIFIIIAVLQVTLYLLTTHKTFLFYPVALFILFIIVSKLKYHIGFIAAIGSSFGILVALGINKLIGDLMIASMVISRIFFLPAQISFQYFEYFSENGFVYLSHSIFSRLFRDPVYLEHPIRIIGQVYYTNNWPNTGYLGDAFMNFGVFGMIFFSLIFGAVLVIIESLANTPFKLTVTKIFIVLFMFSSANIGLLTSMNNGGLILFMLLLYLFNDVKANKELANNIINSSEIHSITEREI
jgi:hypothetical protein